MNELDLLIMSGRNSAIWRGHKMPKQFTRTKDTAHAYCIRCGMGVFADTRPLPNSIDIHGKAVALSCPGKPASAAVISQLFKQEAA